MRYLINKALSLLAGFTLQTACLAQTQRNDIGNEVTGSNSPGGIIFLTAVIVLVLIFGGKDAKKTMGGLILLFVGVVAYTFLLFKLGNLLQQEFAPTKHKIGLFTVATCIVGWFGPIWWWSSRDKNK
jgi:ACR3 family arsenite efflux pump ArsB